MRSIPRLSRRCARTSIASGSRHLPPSKEESKRREEDAREHAGSSQGKFPRTNRQPGRKRSGTRAMTRGDYMTTPAQTHETTVRAQVVVDAPIERAFAVFTDGIGSWFPPEYNLIGVEIAERVFEPR